MPEKDKKGLGSEATSFLWKLMHRLLPNEQRLARILPNSSALCKYCPDPHIADLEHCFFGCIKTGEVARKLLETIRNHDPSVTPAGLLRLEFQEEGEQEMPLVWTAAHTLSYMWKKRATGHVVDLTLTRAMLESKINLLRETRYSNHAIIINQIVDALI